MDDLSELLLVKGIWDHPEIYWGGAATNHPGASFQHHLGFGNAPGEAPNYPFGLVDLFTPFSSGKININTADANVLQLLPGVDANVAAQHHQIARRPRRRGRHGGRHAVSKPRPACRPPALIPPRSRAWPPLCDVRSTTFKVTVTARIGNYKRDFNAILFRPPAAATSRS